MSIIKVSMRLASKVHISSPSIIYTAKGPLLQRTPIKTARSSSLPRRSLLIATPRILTSSATGPAESAGKNSDPSTSSSNPAQKPNEDLEGRQTNAPRPEAGSHQDARRYNDRVPEAQQNEEEDLDEDAEEARVEKILGFKPKPQTMPKGKQAMPGGKVATEFGSTPVRKEEDDWKCWEFGVL